MTSALSRVMDQAAAAAEASPATGNELAPYAQGGAVQQYQQPTRPTLDSMADSAGIQVDDYLTVKDTGFRLGEMKGVFEEARVRIDLTEVVPIISVRSTRQGRTTFFKSYDGGLTTSQGQNFAQAVQHAQATGDKTDGPYTTAEIPAELLQDVSDGKTKVNAGLRIGITPSITGVKFFTKFYNELRRAGLQQAVVDVTIRHKAQSNTAGNEWGVVEFVDFAPANAA
jgi:hypothetical protein